ncbi:PREDICTED: peroxisomal membrane protein 2 [Thamnophis sirtalis]|uniref:Peroxisomal membrane protein 2 n=1 Tax=Thamnophis sirtalis TaxID=35019 RepID=A0A6I9Y733_9SAUR|nr:PREDICTED: peroxisomal membrane protein 2 [Thamnophis sirtalis]XP_032085959.1 peroxisomal membrane protein 2 [Thamnophis elegans]
MSPVHSKPDSVPLSRRLLLRYLLLLRLYPVLTKAASSAFLSALGSLLSQVIEKSQKKRSLDWREPLRFAIYGFLFTGPLSHYFYLYLEQLVPSDAPFSLLKRLLVDRLIVSPAFLALFFLVMNFLEGKDMSEFSKKIKSGYWTSLKMNWKVWTPVQVINFTYVPLQFQVLFGNLVAVLWFAYLASVKKR